MDASEFGEIVAAVREFVRTEVIPAEEVIEETDDVPGTIRAAAAELGLFGYALPEEYGGLGLSVSEEVQVAIELGYTAPAFRSMFGTNNGIAGQVLVNFGTDDQKQRFLPGLAAGSLVASFALTEPEAGSDPSGLRTRAVRDGDGYRLTGQKRFITNASRADILMVFARTAEADNGAAGLSVFIVPTDAPGVTIAAPDRKMGQHGSTTSDIFFDEVPVPAEDLVGGVEGKGFASAMTSLAKGRITIAALCVGLAKRILDESATYAATASQGGEPIGRFQLVQAMLADSYTEIYAGEAMVKAAAAAYDDGSDRRLAPSATKLYCSEMVGRVADRGVQIHGGTGYMHGVPVERFYRDARLYRIYEGTSEVQRVVVGRQILKAATP